MEKISNFQVYIRRMSMSLLDKLWFMGLTNASRYFDFGCADGSLLRGIDSLQPDAHLIGYDNSRAMIKAAKSNVPNAAFLQERSEIDLSGEPTCLICSSVFHEIYSYSKDVDKDRSMIFDSHAEWIAIRDMFISEKSFRKSTLVDSARVLQASDTIRLAEFETKWGPISEQQNLMHYLLKYQYTENWKRECAENYFPMTLEMFLESIPKTYKVEYIDHYILPYTKLSLQRDFGVNLEDKTHAKILLHRINAPSGV